MYKFIGKADAENSKIIPARNKTSKLVLSKTNDKREH